MIDHVEIQDNPTEWVLNVKERERRNLQIKILDANRMGTFSPRRRQRRYSHYIIKAMVQKIWSVGTFSVPKLVLIRMKLK